MESTVATLWLVNMDKHSQRKCDTDLKLPMLPVYNITLILIVIVIVSVATKLGDNARNNT